jgi:hypothetical protein
VVPVNKLLVAFRRESAATLARETLWRTNRWWKQTRFAAEVGSPCCPVEFRPCGYYRPTGEAWVHVRNLILDHAERLCQGEFPCLGYGLVKLGHPPAWNLDFVSGKDWPQVSSQKLKPVRHDGSDVKVPWELSRLQFLPVLGKAWVLSKEDHYRRTAAELLSDWIKKNPVGTGINWTLAMEAALRSMSICFLLELLGPRLKEEEFWVQDVTRSLWQHLLFIEAHNEFSHFARSNHYLSNIVGLFCLSVHLDGPGMEARRESYRRLVEQEILHQVYRDGGDYEASTGYHVLVTQMFTSALLLMKAQGPDPNPDFASRLRSMYRFLSALADDHGRVPQIGDCDDGRVELLADDLERMLQPPEKRDSLTISSLLGIGESLFSEPYRGEREKREEEAAWYGLSFLDRKDGVCQAPAQHAKVFPKTRLAIGRIGEGEAIFLAVQNGVGGKGSHTHNDKLSVVLRIAGEEFLCDSGTYCYTRDIAKRNYLRSTAAHTTVVIDGEEQNRFSNLPGAVFMISDDAHTSAIQQNHVDGTLAFTASHDGYQRIGITHARTVKLDPARLVLIEDLFTGTGEHEFEASFHLPSSWQVQLAHVAGSKVSCRALGSRPVEMEWSAATELHLECVSEEISKTYGICIMASRVLVRTKSHTPFQLLTRISW